MNKDLTSFLKHITAYDHNDNLVLLDLVECDWLTHRRERNTYVRIQKKYFYAMSWLTFLNYS